MKLTSGNV